jgi:L-fuconolactonase
VPVIDAQLHVFEPNTVRRPWTGAGSPLAEATGEQAVALMDAAGVDAAIIVSPWLNYLADASYAYEVAATFPGRFAVVAPVDPQRSDQSEFVTECADHSSLVGMRLMLWAPPEREKLAAGGYETLLAELERRGIPLCVALGPSAADARLIAERHPELAVVIDHLGLPSTPVPPAAREPFARLADILDLAELPNVAIKATGMPALSHAPYPFADIHQPLRRLLDAYGPERTLWGTDWTRTHAFLDYEQGVSWLDSAGLSPHERALIEGGAAQQVFGTQRVLG